MRPPPTSKARLSDADGVLRIEVPTRLAHNHLSGSAAAAIILGLVTVPAWILYFNL